MTFSVVSTLRLANGALFPMPITLDVTAAQVASLGLVGGARITLRDPRDESALAILTGELLLDVVMPITGSNKLIFVLCYSLFRLQAG